MRHNITFLFVASTWLLVQPVFADESMSSVWEQNAEATSEALHADHQMPVTPKPPADSREQKLAAAMMAGKSAQFFGQACQLNVLPLRQDIDTMISAFLGEQYLQKLTAELEKMKEFLVLPVPEDKEQCARVALMVEKARQQIHALMVAP